jgi:hypothetical protein
MWIEVSMMDLADLKGREELAGVGVFGELKLRAY